MKPINILRLLSLVGICYLPLALANDTTMVGRYLTITNQPLIAQTHLLTQTFEVRFPASVKTIGDAVYYLLRFSGYSLVDRHYLPKEAAALLVQPLPAVDRHFGPMTLETGLQTLAGEPFGWLIDPVHRLLSLRLLPRYQPLYQSKTTNIFRYSEKPL